MKRTYINFVLTILVIVMLALIAPVMVRAQAMAAPPVGQALYAMPASQAPINPVDVLNVVMKIALGFVSLVGVSALVSALVNLLKVIKVVQDGTADKWAAGLNLLLFIALVVFGVFKPELATEILDGYAGQIAMVILFVLGFITQIVTSKPIYDQLKAANVPLIGKSYSPYKDA